MSVHMKPFAFGAALALALTAQPLVASDVAARPSLPPALSCAAFAQKFAHENKMPGGSAVIEILRGLPPRWGLDAANAQGPDKAALADPADRPLDFTERQVFGPLVSYALTGLAGIHGELHCDADGRFSILMLQSGTDEASILRAKLLAAEAYGVATMSRPTFWAAIVVEKVANASRGAEDGHAADFSLGLDPQPSALITARFDGSIEFQVGVYGP
jgi:hypothetical protein